MSEAIPDRTKFIPKSWYQLLAVLWVTYIVLMVRSPIDYANLARLGISLPWYYAIQFTLGLSVLVIWALAMYGAVSFKRYAYNIRASADGAALNTAANGLMVIAIGIIIPSLLTQVRTYYDTADEMVAVLTIAINQVQVLVYLTGFYLIWRGSSHLVKQTRSTDRSQKWLTWWLLPLSVIAGGYAYMSAVDPNRLAVTTKNVKFATYYLPDALLVGLIILPYVLSWVLALSAAANLSFYRQTVKGSLYRQALKGLVRGLIAVTLFSIGMQILRTLSSSLVELNTAAILLLVYFILLAYAGSYWLIARGARRLQAIEEAI